MATIIYLSPTDEIPAERHVAVIVHRGFGGMELGYFFDSAKGDTGGSAGCDWRMSEAIERATRFAKEQNIDKVVVRAACG
ncbi:hypothetical protein [Novosphingobium sp. CECT 9465]|uniref:hypothetical protein n=1 Tax=Novosphingobium sp. CECT 9465 TaxID=2829794 RepID=UPI001E5334EA|nr:hypothetical protein [Novosphingobium sp. CECT 9465]CAH0499034.1 hypothetical protein NVSP9465_04131 [Novosphingobium sp. CECT 9465]